MRFKCFIAILALFCTLEADPSVRLIKKKIHDGLKFSRTMKYTDKSIGSSKNSHNSNETQELSLDVLIVADFSTYQAFLEMTNGDPVGAQHYLNSYLTAVFDQAKLIYDNIKFGDATLKLSFAGTFTAFREEDCPLWLSWEESEEEIAKKLDESDKDLDLNSTIIDVDQDIDDTNSTLFNDDYSYNSTGIDPDNIKIHKKLRHFVDTTMDQLQETNTTEMSLRIDSKKAIDLFTTWIKQYAEFLPKHEHAVLITKFDLVSINGHSATQGMAYVGNVCQLGESSSVVEDIGGSLTALIAAHEIGHSLGAVHDGAMEAAECDSSENYLLAVAVSGSTNRKSFLNSRQMSNCSINAIIENLKKPSASCIKKWKPKNSQNTTSDFSKKPGESISVMQQCQISFGPTFGNCLNPGYYHGKSICERVWCSDRKIGSSDACQTLNYFPAFDGTTCGYNMWCIEGECVRNPKKWMDCKDMNSKTCSKYSESKLKHFCKSKDFREVCCRTCAKKGKVDV